LLIPAKVGKNTVIPAKAGIQRVLSSQNGCTYWRRVALEGTFLDSGLRRNDE
jgi:hypothetical protein